MYSQRLDTAIGGSNSIDSNMFCDFQVFSDVGRGGGRGLQFQLRLNKTYWRPWLYTATSRKNYRYQPEDVDRCQSLEVGWPSQRLQIIPSSGPKSPLATFPYANFTASPPKICLIFTQDPQFLIKSFHAWFCNVLISAMESWCLRTLSHSGMKNCSNSLFPAVEGVSVNVFVDHLVEDTSGAEGERFVSPREIPATRLEPRCEKRRSLRVSFPATSA